MQKGEDMGRAGVFLDRDGTINEQMGYINHLSRFILLPGAAPGIRLFNQNNMPVAVVTNQSGLARGYFPATLLEEVHQQMTAQLAANGARIDRIYVCPHHPQAEVERYRQRCQCRKPRIGLVQQAAAELGLDLKRSFMVGDRWSDLECGARAGATPVLVLTGYGRGDLQYVGPYRQTQTGYVGQELEKCGRWILPRREFLGPWEKTLG